MKLRVDQILAGFADGDAISAEARALRDLLREQGHEADIYADPVHTSPGVRHECRDAAAYSPGDILIHHYSIGSPILDQFAVSPARKVLIYHNITPAVYFRPYDSRITAQLEKARRELAGMAGRVDSIWADSEFNARELRDMGIDGVKVFPLLFNTGDLDHPDDPEVLRRLSGPLTTILTVSRIAPNKRIEMAIKAFHYYVRAINPFSRLVIIGSGRSCPRYYDLLQMMVCDLQIPNVCFEGFASVQGLPTYYRRADLFLSTSDHEGYCLPLLEAMYHRTPVLAHHTGGTPEAMGGAGVLYDDLDPAALAILMDLMISRSGFREAVLLGQSERIRQVKSRDAATEVKALLDAVYAVH